MNISRRILIFEKDKNELYNEYEIHGVSLEQLREIFKPSEDDPELFLPYWIDENRAENLKKHIKFDFDFDRYVYDFQTYQL